MLKIIIPIVLLLIPAVSAFANRHPTLGVPPDLIGSDESLAKQNEIADKYGFKRIKNLAELQVLICAGVLERVVSARENPTYYLTVEKRFRYARPWDVLFLNTISNRFFDSFGKPLKITELVRTEQYQKLLVRRGKSHADGSLPERRSAHLVGAIDISKRPLTKEEIEWLRDELVYWETEEMIEATEEIYNNTFHIMVFPSYLGTDVAVSRDEDVIKESGCEIRTTHKHPMKKQPHKKRKSVRR